MPKTREEFWRAKFDRNTKRDLENELRLEAMGWTVRVIWECEARNEESLRSLIEKAIPLFGAP